MGRTCPRIANELRRARRCLYLLKGAGEGGERGRGAQIDFLGVRWRSDAHLFQWRGGAPSLTIEFVDSACQRLGRRANFCSARGREQWSSHRPVRGRQIPHLHQAITAAWLHGGRRRRGNEAGCLSNAGSRPQDGRGGHRPASGPPIGHWVVAPPFVTPGHNDGSVAPLAECLAVHAVVARFLGRQEGDVCRKTCAPGPVMRGENS